MKYLKGHRVQQIGFLTKYEFGTFVGIFQKHLDLFAEELEEDVAVGPSQDEEAQDELQSQPPHHRTPAHLIHNNRIM